MELNYTAILDRFMQLASRRQEDFVPVPLDVFRNGLPPESNNMIRRGYQIIMDKDGLESLVASSISTDLTNGSPPNNKRSQAN